MQLNMIFARAANGVIGKNGVMPWNLPEDMAHFKRLTNGWPVIMGRKTWDSLPAKFRPLPGRRNIVISRQNDWRQGGAEKVANLQDALTLCGDSQEVWVIGGAQIYAQAEPLAERAEVTELAKDFDGDAYAPELGSAWKVKACEDHAAADGMKFSFVTYTKSS